VTDQEGVRLAKRHDALSLRAFREKGVSSKQLQESALSAHGSSWLPHPKDAIQVDV
jgi:hypothetical protein